MVASIALALSWKGFREEKREYVWLGLAGFVLAILVFLTSIIITTPTEHADELVTALVKSVEENNSETLALILDPNVEIVDQWKNIETEGISGAIDGMNEFHKRHKLRFNISTRFIAVERESDVRVDISMLSRVSGIGTVPSRWRIIVAPNAEGIWRIVSVDVLEILGRSYR
jgi:hypothetical protein|tara:strand:+ start:3250 stop:3765 length:516 start_codon:yes stop_codon:yes gene_type:complete